MTVKRRIKPRRTTEDQGFSRSVGHAIKVLRTARGLSRRTLAEKAGVSYPYLSEIENGTKAGSQGVLRAIAEALEVPMHEILAAAEELSVEQPQVAYMKEPDAMPASPAGPQRSRWFTAATRHAPTTASSSDRDQLLNDLQRQLFELSSEDLQRVADIVRRLNH